MAESVQDALKAPREDLTVEEGMEVRLEPENQGLVRGRHVVEVRTFEDLQGLSLVPERLSERDVSEAIKLDDEEARTVAREQLARNHAACVHAPMVEAPPKLAYRSELNRVYTGVRKSYNPHLAEVMSGVATTPYAFHDLHVAVTRGWYTAVTLNAAMLKAYVVWLFKDVTIGKNATLTLGAKEKVLHCGDLRIHVGGKLLISGSGVKVRCLSAQGNLP